MKLGFVSAILPELSFEELIDYAAGQGFPCVEVRIHQSIPGTEKCIYFSIK